MTDQTNENDYTPSEAGKRLMAYAMLGQSLPPGPPDRRPTITRTDRAACGCGVAEATAGDRWTPPGPISAPAPDSTSAAPARGRWRTSGAA